MSASEERKNIGRRDFIRHGAATAVGLGIGLATESRAQSDHKSKKDTRSRVVLVRDAAAMTPEGQRESELMGGMLERAVCAYTGEQDGVSAIRHFINPGDTVGIKMNVMMTATHPELVAALARLLVRAGVSNEKIIVWDRDNAGIGVKGAYERKMHYGFGDNSVSRIITEEATALINIPALKSHWLSGMAGAIKNWCGAVTAINVRDYDTPFPIHGDSCADLGMLGAIDSIRDKSRLVLLDCLQPLFEGGPQVNPAYLWRYGGLMAAEDPVAVDTLCTKLLQAKRDRHRGRPWPINPPPKHVPLADTKWGLGVADPERIDLIALGEEKDRLI
ncbi:MAG: DUF362 domain-containing protein [Candidatus Glassbacteria bacterium]|nr:DUF362 domain-containing protein [Candidatus Glassbacteria bacterium]